MNKEALLRGYEQLVGRYQRVGYGFLFLLALVLVTTGHYSSSETIKSVVFNIASACFYVVLIEFLFISKIELLVEENAVRQAARQAERRNDKISIVLNCGSKEKELPVELRRAEFTRAEILGRIGMIPMKSKGARFFLAYLATRAFLQDVNRLAESEGAATLFIHCTEEEFSQFDLS